MNWRFESGVLYDKNGPPKFKGKFYKVIVRPSMLHGVECWMIKNSSQENESSRDVDIEIDVWTY